MRGDLKDIPATVLRIEYSPERSSHIALVQYQAWQQNFTFWATQDEISW